MSKMSTEIISWQTTSPNLGKIFLGIHLAVTPVGISLVAESGLIAEMNLSYDRYFSENLIAEIEAFCQKNGVVLESLSGMGVTVGPGGYTGLRVGITCVKSISQILGIPLYPINTLDALAFEYRHLAAVAFCLLPARTNEFNCALFTLNSPLPTRLTPTFTWSIDQAARVLSKIRGQSFVLGCLPPNLPQLLPVDTHLKIYPAQIHSATVAQLAFLASLEEGPPVLPAIRPVYSHDAIASRVK